MVTSEFPEQQASSAENVSIWWCLHESMSTERGMSIHFKILGMYGIQENYLAICYTGEL